MSEFLSKLQYTREERLKVYKTFPQADNEYALNRLADGESIDPLKLRSASLKEYLITFQKTDEFVNAVLENIRELHSTRGYSFIVGDYGSGKTQFRDLFIDRCMEYDIITLKADLGLMSFASFAINFCSEVRSKITTHYPNLLKHINNNLKIIENTSSDAEIYQNLAQILIQLSSKNLNVFIHLDEIDMVPNLEAFTPWANFIVMINQHVETGVHIVFYMAPRDINRLWDKDSRLVRFNRYISKAIAPGNTFGTQVVEAIAQLMALYESVTNIMLFNSMVKLMGFFLDDSYSDLQMMNLRFINTNFYQVIEFLSNLQEKEQWAHNEVKFLDHNTENANDLKISVKNLFKDLNIDFEFNETDYFSEYNYEEESFNLFRIFNEEKILLTTIKTEIFYLDNPNFSEAIAQIKLLPTREPKVYVVFGQNIKEGEQMLEELEETVKENSSIIFINSILAHPLILKTIPAYHEDFNFQRQLFFWFNTISKAKTLLGVFFENVARKNYESELQRQLEELRQQLSISVFKEPIQISDDSQSRDMMGDQSSVLERLTETEIEILLRIMAIYSHNRAKKKVNIIREVAEDLIRNDILNVTDEQIVSIIKRLINREFLKETKVQYRKTNNWSVNDIFEYFELK